MSGSSPTFGLGKGVSAKKPGEGLIVAGPTDGATDCANIGTIRLRWGSTSLKVDVGLPSRLVYHDLYLGGKALIEREIVDFDLTKSYLCPSFVEGHTAKGVGLRVVDSYTGNHREDDFTSLETIRRWMVRMNLLVFKKRMISKITLLRAQVDTENRDVHKFNAIYNQTELLSGENEENLYTRVLTLFRDQNGVEFQHRDAWLFLKDKYKWTNPESTQARRTRGRVTSEDEPEIFGEDAIPRPSGAPRKSKSQRSSASSSATFGSSKNRLTEFFQEQIQLDREAKKESLDCELAARLAVVELQKRNEDLKILTFDTMGMNSDDAAKIEALKEKTRATYFNF
ncbi:hypothetical protein Tco_0189768 [Tanacetum coccineum]